MKCPQCGGEATQVIDTRTAEASTEVRRRRRCTKCKARFTTYERPEAYQLLVRKRDGQLEPYRRDKLERSVALACSKRNISPKTLTGIVDGVETELYKLGRGEVTSGEIGTLVMWRLQAVDPVARFRYASIHQNWTDSDLREHLCPHEDSLQEVARV